MALLLGVSLSAPRWSGILESPGAAHSPAGEPASTAPAAPGRVESSINVQLFFQSPTHTQLVAERRLVRLDPQLHRQIALVVEELIRGPEDPSLLATLPPGTQLHEVFEMPGGIAVVSLDLPEAPTPTQIEGDAQPPAIVPGGESQADASLDIEPLSLGGSKDELLSVYSIVNSVAVNFPAVRRVRLVVDADRHPRLGAHVDLGHSFPPDLTFLLPPEEWQAVPQDDAAPGGEG